MGQRAVELMTIPWQYTLVRAAMQNDSPENMQFINGWIEHEEKTFGGDYDVVGVTWGWADARGKLYKEVIDAQARMEAVLAEPKPEPEEPPMPQMPPMPAAAFEFEMPPSPFDPNQGGEEMSMPPRTGRT